MKYSNKWMWAAALVMVAGLSACSSDEPAPEPPQPDKPETPAKDWKGENPHGFMLDVTELKLPVSERGFLTQYKWNDATGEYDEVDEIVMVPWDTPQSGQKMMTSLLPVSGFSLTCEGTLADPFENQESYRTICTQLGFRPKSQFSMFEELMALPAPEMDRVFLMDEIVSIDLITEKEFDKDHPAGSSMGRSSAEDTGISIMVMSGKPFFDRWKEGLYLDGINGPGYLLSAGTCDKEWNANPGADMSLYIFGYPEKAGDYPMTLRMTFAKSGVKECRFTVRFVAPVI